MPDTMTCLEDWFAVPERESYEPRTCGCGARLEYAGRGRPPQYCRACNAKRAKLEGKATGGINTRVTVEGAGEADADDPASDLADTTIAKRY